MNNHNKKTTKPQDTKSINHSTEPKQKFAKGKWWIIVAIVFALLLTVALIWHWISRPPAADEPQQDAAASELLRQDSPLDLFLDSLTDQEKDSLRYYMIDEIPEY